MSLQHYHCNTITATPSLQHHHCNTITATPSPQHHHCNTITATPSLQHHHCNTITATPSPQHHHCNTITATPSLQHHHRNTITATPSLQHHHCNDVNSCLYLIVKERRLQFSATYCETYLKHSVMFPPFFHWFEVGRYSLNDACMIISLKHPHGAFIELQNSKCILQPTGIACDEACHIYLIYKTVYSGCAKVGQAEG